MTRFEKIRAVFWVAAITLVGTMLFLGIRPAGACTWAVATVASYHTDRDGHNERNWGAGVECDATEDMRVIGGIYRNSQFKDSVYLGATYAPLRLGAARFGLMGGLITGYAEKVLPIAVPLMQIEGRRFGINIVAVPRINADKSGVVGLQLKVKF